MAGCIAVKEYAAVLGKTADTDWAMQLDAVPVAPTLCMYNGQWRQFNRVAELEPGMSFATRLVALLAGLWPQLTTAPAAEPVLLVLPEQLASDPLLAQFVSSLQQAYPRLLSHSACQIFPYGCSAALLALSAARQLLEEGTPVVWLIAVDSPVTSYLPLATGAAASAGQAVDSTDALQTEQVLWSEGAVAMALKQDDAGLRCQHLAADATVSHSSADLAMGHLFVEAAQSSKGLLNQLYLPDNGSSAVTACWQRHYPCLAPIIDMSTQLHFPAYYTGELGAAGGVYRLLHLYLGYKSGSLNGVTLQCEISPRLYRAVAVFSWQHASSISEF